MKLGLLTDIHECVEVLRIALERFRQERVDQVVVIGDVCEMGERLEETCRLLAEANTIGVWGNHDFGLCVHPPPELRGRYSSAVLDFMESLRPRLEVDGCYFAHVEPWLDPESLDDLWYFDPDGFANSPYKRQRIFTAVPHRLILAGHYHQWLHASETTLEPWNGGQVLNFATAHRHFVVIHAVCDGYFAILDTGRLELVPYCLR
jgi:hypothetical protein